MNRKLIFALFGLVLAGLLTACNGTVPPVTSEPTTMVPTEVPPTAVPSPTPTLEPTAIPTEVPTKVPTPTATPDPAMAIVWEIAHQMLAECTGRFDVTTGPTDPDLFNQYQQDQDAYLYQLQERVSEEHPEVWIEQGGGSSVVAFFRTGISVLANDGVNPNPFAFADPWESMMANPEGVASEATFCEGYVFTYDGTLAENTDGDGVLVGEAYLFYEVGGTQPYFLDGELKEVEFTFPPVP